MRSAARSLTLLLALALAGCDRAPAGAGPGSGSVAGGSATSSSTGSGSSSSTGGPAPDDGWRPVTWRNACPLVELAVRPTQQEAKIGWTACPSGSPGCLRASLPTFNVASFGALLTSVARTAGGRSFAIDSAIYSGTDTDSRMTVYGPDGVPEIVWRTKGDCILDPALLGTDHLWFGATWIAEDTSATAAYVVGTYASVQSQTHVLPVGANADVWWANDSLLVLVHR